MSSHKQIEVSLILSEGESRASRQIREAVFVEEQKVPSDIEYDEYEEISTHVLACLDGVPVGTARWRQTERGQKLERFAVLKSSRGRGVGEALVNFVLDQLDKPDSAYLNSQMSAIPFYTNLGFVATGPIFYEADIPHRKMIRKSGQKK